MGVLAMRLVGLGLLLRVAPVVQGQITIMHADKIVAMQDGRIVEVGTHADLLANRSLYYHLYKAQFEHALSMPMPEEWASGAEVEPSEDRLALAIQ